MRVTHITTAAGAALIASTNALIGHPPAKGWHALVDGPSTSIWVVPFPAWTLCTPLTRWFTGRPRRRDFVEFDVPLSRLRWVAGVKGLFPILAPLTLLGLAYPAAFISDLICAYGDAGQRISHAAASFAADASAMQSTEGGWLLGVSALGVAASMCQIKIPVDVFPLPASTRRGRWPV